MQLKQIGALLTTVGGVQCKDDGDLTVLGEIVAGLPVDCRLGKVIREMSTCAIYFPMVRLLFFQLIVYGHLFNVLEEAVIIAAGLLNKSIFTTPMEKKQE